MVKALRSLEVNQSGVIKQVSARGELGRRIRDMGLIPGAEFRVVGRAPLNDPIALRLKGFTLTLREQEAALISCEVCETPGVCETSEVARV